MSEIRTDEPLEALARHIAEKAKEADEHVIAAAMLVKEARRRVDAGEAGDVEWREWAREKINLSESRLRELQRIAEADDPAKELDRQRELTRKRVEKHREREAIATWQQDKERKTLIRWAKEAQIDEVRRVLEFARSKAAGPSVTLTEPTGDAAPQKAA